MAEPLPAINLVEKFRECEFQLVTGHEAYLDFARADPGTLVLVRASFDGYGCCDCGKKGAASMDGADAKRLLAMVESGELDQPAVRKIVVKYCEQVKATPWASGYTIEGALEEHGLLRYE